MSAVPISYLEDASGFQGQAEALMIPETLEQLQGVLRRAHADGVPVTVVGSGTGVAGGRCAQGGWVVSVEKFRRLEPGPGSAHVGAAVALKDLQAAVLPTGQFYAPDPTEYSAALGGTIATNASGSRSFRYGDTRRHVLGLTVVLIDGTVLELRRGDAVPFEIPAIPMPATTKHSAGYWLKAGMDYLDLFIGSEGTLGVVTEAEVRLLPNVTHLLTGVIFFGSDDGALAAVEAWRGVERLRMLEYVDAGSIGLLRPKYSEIPAEAQAALLIEQELDAEDSPEVDAWLDRLDAAGAMGEASWFASTAADRERFRRFRHALPESVNDTVRRNGFLKLGSDFAVPVAKNREMMAYYQRRLSQEFPGKNVIFGHIGDAHVHVNILPASQDEFDRGKAMMAEFAVQAVALGGTVGAEHGLGKRKAHFLELQYTREQLDSMMAVKRRLDPKWLLGRGTLFPAPNV